MSYAAVANRYGAASVVGYSGYASVLNLISYAVAGLTMPVISTGEGVPNQLIDGDTGALLYDADTGAAIVW